MIKGTINNGEIHSMIISGSVKDLAMDVITLIAYIHDHIKADDEMAAVGFKNLVMSFMSADSPLWREKGQFVTNEELIKKVLDMIKESWKQ